MKRLISVAILGLASLACSSSPTPVCGSKLGSSGYVAGKRLKPSGYKHTNGAIHQTGITDSTFGPCEFLNVAGETVCAPSETAVYADADCLTPVYVTFTCSPPASPQYVS